MKKAIILGFLLLFVLIVLVSDNFALPSPLAFMERAGMTQLSFPSKADIGIDKMGYQPMPPIYQPADDLTSPERYIVRSAGLTLKVEKVSSAMEEAGKYTQSIGGLVTNSSLSKTKKGYVGYLYVRVPGKEFTNAIAYYKRLAVEVEEEQTNAYDETGSVTNVEKNRRKTEAKLDEYRSLLEKAKTSDERLKIQRQIDELEREIESLKQQEQSLKGQAAMSSISLTFNEKKFSLPFLGDLGLDSVIEEGVYALKKVAVSLVVLVIWGVIFTPIWLPLWLIIRWLKNKK